MVSRSVTGTVGGSTSESALRLALVGETITRGDIVCVDGTVEGPIAPTDERVLRARADSSRGHMGAVISVPPWDAPRGIIGVAAGDITDAVPGTVVSTGRVLVKMDSGLVLVPGDTVYVANAKTPGIGTNVPQDGVFNIPIGILKDTNGYNPAKDAGRLVWIDLQLQPGPWLPSRWVGYRAAFVAPDTCIDVDIPLPSLTANAVLFETHVAFWGSWTDGVAQRGSHFAQFRRKTGYTQHDELYSAQFQRKIGYMQHGGSHSALFQRTTGYAQRDTARWEKTMPVTVDVATISDSAYPDVELLVNDAGTHARVRLLYHADLVPRATYWAAVWSVSVLLTSTGLGIQGGTLV